MGTKDLYSKIHDAQRRMGFADDRSKGFNIEEDTNTSSNNSLSYSEPDRERNV